MLKDPTNPNHHNYVTVNKYQRKKEQSKNINVLVIFKNKQSTFNDTENFRNIQFCRCNWTNSNFDITSCKNPYLNKKGCKIAWDDVNHTSYRVIKNGKFIREGNFRYTYKSDKIKHFKRI